MKRFYKQVEVQPVDDGYAVTLDGRSIKSPGKRALTVPNAQLADAVAEEWRVQEEQIKPETMLMTRHVNAALDRVGPNRATIIEDLLRYVSTDQLCYRAESPTELVERQQQEWTPLLDWAREEHGLRFELVSGIIHKDQPAETLTRAEAILVACNDLILSALHTLVSISGSFVLGLAARDGRISAEEMLALALLDELYQAEVWGSDSFAEKRRRDLKAEIDAAHAILSLLQAD